MGKLQGKCHDAFIQNGDVLLSGVLPAASFHRWNSRVERDSAKN